MGKANIFMFIWCIWDFAVFFLFGLDKWLARHHRWRISEKTLLACTICMGGMGALMGMQIFHHKTRKRQFIWTVPIALLFQLAFGIFMVYRYMI